MFRMLSSERCDVLLMPPTTLLQQGHYCKFEEQKKALEDNIESTESQNTPVIKIWHIWKLTYDTKNMYY